VHRRAELREIVVAAVYLAAMAAWIYGVARPQVGYGSDAAAVGFLVVLAAVHLGAGWGIGRWWAVLLPLVAIVLALPAGTPERGEDPLPIWFGVAVFIAPAGALLIAVAATLRRRAGHLRQRGAEPTLRA
jgi:peptidoglycan/LPS O-acetylase OafA/YrhL